MNPNLINLLDTKNWSSTLMKHSFVIMSFKPCRVFLVFIIFDGFASSQNSTSSISSWVECPSKGPSRSCIIRKRKSVFTQKWMSSCALCTQIRVRKKSNNFALKVFKQNKVEPINYKRHWNAWHDKCLTVLSRLTGETGSNPDSYIKFSSL